MSFLSSSWSSSWRKSGIIKQTTIFLTQGNQYGRGYTMAISTALDTSDPYKGTLSNFSVSVGFFNAVLGSGILLFPKLSYQAGIPLCTILMIISAGLLWGSGILLAKSSELSKTCSFHKLMVTALVRYSSVSASTERGRLASETKTVHSIGAGGVGKPWDDLALPNKTKAIHTKCEGAIKKPPVSDDLSLATETKRINSTGFGKSPSANSLLSISNRRGTQLSSALERVVSQFSPSSPSVINLTSPSPSVINLGEMNSNFHGYRISDSSEEELSSSLDELKILETVREESLTRCKCLALLLEVFVFLDCFITIVSYIQCLGEYGLATYKGLTKDEKNLRVPFRLGSGVLATLLALIAGSKLQNMVWLNYVGSTAIMYVIFYTLTSPLWNDVSESNEDFVTEDLYNFFPRKTNSPVKVFVGLFSTMGYAFPNYFCSARYYNESKKKDNFSLVVGLTYVFIVVLYGSYGFMGANLPEAQWFLEDKFNLPDSAIFPNYYSGRVQNKFALTLVFLAMFCTVISVLPVYILELAQCFQTIVIETNLVNSKFFGKLSELITKIVWGLTATVLATWITRLETVIEIDGALILTPLGYFFPPIIYLMLVYKRKEKEKLWVVFSWILLLAGAIFFVISWYIFFTG